MFFFFRQMERWLHQHIFKVGWLTTQNLQTTTIVYYTVFLPGVVLHEVVLWLVAGILNVRAEHAIAIPEKQEIGELKLNFVRIHPRIEPYKKVIITLSPLLVGTAFIWHVATNVFVIQDFAATISTGQLNDVARGFQQLTRVTDFWLWFYLVFTVGNTMFPSFTKELQPVRLLVTVGVVLVIILSIIGISNQFLQTATLPLRGFIETLQIILTMMISVNLLMTVLLGLIEYTIEATTHRNVTFRKGKMVVLTPEEVKAEREKERQRAKAPKSTTLDIKTPTVYQLSFPVPGAPGREAVSQMALELLADEPKTVPEARKMSVPEPMTLTTETTPKPDKEAIALSQPVLNLPVSLKSIPSDVDDGELSGEERGDEDEPNIENGDADDAAVEPTKEEAPPTNVPLTSAFGSAFSASSANEDDTDDDEDKYSDDTLDDDDTDDERFLR
jgi:hypothetical protein